MGRVIAAKRGDLARDGVEEVAVEALPGFRIVHLIGSGMSHTYISPALRQAVAERAGYRCTG